MTALAEPIDTPSRRKLHWLIAAPLTLWCLLWLVFNGWNYLSLTWHLFATLRWLSFALLINPCFAIWIGAFSSSVWAPLSFLALPWAEYDAVEFSRGKMALLVFFVPLLLGLDSSSSGHIFTQLHTEVRMAITCFYALFPSLVAKAMSRHHESPNQAMERTADRCALRS